MILYHLWSLPKLYNFVHIHLLLLLSANMLHIHYISTFLYTCYFIQLFFKITWKWEKCAFIQFILLLPLTVVFFLSFAFFVCVDLNYCPRLLAFSLKNFVYYFLQNGSSNNKFSVFVFLGKSLFCLQFWKIALLDIEFLVDSFFFFKHFEYIIPLPSSLRYFFWSQLLILLRFPCEG